MKWAIQMWQAMATQIFNSNGVLSLTNDHPLRRRSNYDRFGFPRQRRNYKKGKMRGEVRNERNGGGDIVKRVSEWIWGKGLPPAMLVGAVRGAWSSVWKLMMKQMAPSDPSGSYTRPASAFRGRPSHSQMEMEMEMDRYHLYAALSCPWAHRALIVRALKGLQHAVPVSVASPSLSGSWEFLKESNNVDEDEGLRLGPTVDRLNGCRTLKEVYCRRRGGYDGRATVPMLWDSLNNDVLNNESADIIEILNSDFNRVARHPELDLSPPSLRDEIQKWNDIIYPNVNNGVYRCGFAQSQGAYETAVNCLFNTLDSLEVHLATSRYLCGNSLTLADVRLFTTLFRFDPVYHILFKCNKKKLLEYPNLYGYVLDIYQMPGVASTCDLHAIMEGYYRILFPLNPGGIQPVVPLSFDFDSLNKAHNRELLTLSYEKSNVILGS